MAILEPLQDLTATDEGRQVVRVDKSDTTHTVVLVGTLSNIVVSKYVTHFDFTVTADDTHLTGCTNWCHSIRYYDLAEFEAAELTKTLQDELHILAQLSSEVAKDTELTLKVRELYQNLVSLVGTTTISKVAMTSVTGWYSDPTARRVKFLRNL